MRQDEPPRTRARTAAVAVEQEVVEQPLLQNDPGISTGTNAVIDFEQILRDANLVNLNRVNSQTGDGGEESQAQVELPGQGPISRDKQTPAQTLPNPDTPPFDIWYNERPTLSSSTAVGNFALSETPEFRRVGNDDISVHVPAQLKQQIARGEYINLALLLKGAVELNDIHTVGVLRVTEDGKLETHSKPCKDRIATIENWTDAFIIFSSIYLASHIDKTYEILHYMWLIRETAIRRGGTAWREYDEQFRMRQAFSPTPWSVINNDLWWRCSQCQTPETHKQSATPVSVNKPAAVLTCHSFNSGNCKKPSCFYEHICNFCGCPHPAISCPAKRGGNSNKLASPFRRQEHFQAFRGRGRGFGRPFNRF